MFVIDASAAYDAVAGRGEGEELADALAQADELFAPHLIDVEVANAIRGSVIDGRLTVDRATDALGDFAGMTLARYPHLPFLGRIWELRHKLSSYDAAYLSLAEVIGIPLITCDAGLAAVAERTVDVELFPPRTGRQ